MNLALLQAFCTYMQDMRYMQECRRIDENLFICTYIDEQGNKGRFYCDMTRGHSHIFMTNDAIAEKSFHAPFDKKLAQCTKNAAIISISTDGNNRILDFFFTQNAHYKMQHYHLIYEFTGRYTNVILCDENRCVIEALRHIPLHKSSRQVRIGKALMPLPQPDNPASSRIDSNKVPFLLEQHYKQGYMKAKARKKDNVLKTLKKKQEGLIHIKETLPKQALLLESAKTYALYGELIFSSLHLLPTHKKISTHIILPDKNNKNIHIPLPAHVRDLQAAGNWYFAQSKKYAKKAEHLAIQITHLEEKIAFLSQQIALVEYFDDIGDVFLPKNKKSKSQKDSEAFFIDGYKISIGRNAKDNQRLLESAKADDLWFHIKDIPSAHLIIHCGKQMPPNALLQKAAQILVGLYVAHKQGGGDFVVDWTKRRFVKLSANAHVNYSKWQSISLRAFIDKYGLHIHIQK